MSYNSRRSTRSTAPPTQVTYHQNTGRPGVPAQQQPYQMNKPGYQQQVPIQSPQQVQQTVPQAAPQQQQQQQVQQASAVYKTPTPQTPTKPVQAPLATPQTPNLQPKIEITTPMKTLQEQEKIQTPGQTGEAEMDTEGGDSKKWQKRPKPQGYKVNKVLKRRRKNARFRKLLTPKNAIMVLNELQPGVAFDSKEVTNAFNQTTYIVSFEVDGQQFSGEGTSKGAAKQAAAEAAVKSLILKKIAESKRREDSEPMDTTAETAEESQGEGGENATNGGGRRRELPEDEVPWGSLASFALFRLFSEWESQGTYVPFPAGAIPKVATFVHPVPASAIPKAPKKPANPTNLQGTHPVTLVGRLWPGSTFSEISRDGQPPNMTFVMGVTIDGKSFTGTAKNKKDAKKECAKAALTGMGVQWDEQTAQTA